jgi:ribosomal protein L14
VDAAVANLKAMGKKYRIIIWQSLGLNDKYGQNTPDASFTLMMAQLRAAFRLKYGSNIPFLSTNFNNPPAQTFAWDGLWNTMALADPLFFSIPVTGATYIDAGTHFDYAGMKLIAHNMVNRMITSVPGSAGGTGTGTGTGATYTSVWSKVSGPAGGTIVSPNAASTSITGLVAGTYIYRLSVTDNNNVTVTDDVQIVVATGNQPPVANAGTDISITLPVNSTTLNGTASSDPDGTIATYAWTKISGPATFTIANAGASSTALSNLVQGVYSFRLTVTDNAGATSSDTVKVTVNAAPPPGNQPPVANAGGNITITLPTNTTTLNGSASRDPDGTIAAYSWTKLSGPTQFNISNSSAVSTVLSNLVQGVYTFRLQVLDNAGATASDTIKVTVNAAPPVNQPPVANAGANITMTLPVNSTTLNGTASSDPDGTITTYAWSEISGPAQYSIANATAASTALTSLVAGTYVFSLTVTDNGGASTSATVTVTVNAAPPPGNQPPVANAGANITITLPTNVALLNGSGSNDPDGTIVSYSWTQISGPAQYTIANPGSANTGISNLVQGVYIFRLQVSDNGGATASATVTVTVNAAPPPGNVPPIANAGTDITITLPINTTNLDGTGSSDPDGIIVSYSWNKISGPGAITIVNSNTATPSVTGLQAGQYVFELTVTDNNGATSKARVNVLVNNATNQSPVANAGKDTTIALPVSTYLLDGSKSKDPDGTIVKYSWKQLSGPSVAGIANASSVTTQVLGLTTEGDYVFELDVTDNAGAVSIATIKITVTNNFRFTQSFKLYPNPTVASLNLQYIDDNPGKIRILVYDAIGRLVISNEYTKSGSTLTQQLDVTNLKSGEYLLQLVDQSGTTLIRKFIKQ